MVLNLAKVCDCRECTICAACRRRDRPNEPESAEGGARFTIMYSFHIVRHELGTITGRNVSSASRVMLKQSKLEQIRALREDGYVVVPGLVSPQRCEAMRAVAQQQLTEAAAPVEFEADLQYPGAPNSKDALGGQTVRRLLDAYARDPLFAEWATSPDVRGWMELYFGEAPYLSRAHHNCVMTKHPTYGSLTGCHRDV